MKARRGDRSNQGGCRGWVAAGRVALGLACGGAATGRAQQATLDAFNPDPGPSVATLVEQPDGRVLIGGDFSGRSGSLGQWLARVTSDGAADPRFPGGAAAALVRGLAVLDDGRCLVAGGVLQRLLADGTLDATFGPPANLQWIYGLAVQPDGRLIVGGIFTVYDAITHLNIVRLWPDGALDRGFTTEADRDVYAVALQPDGKILLGGAFTHIGATPRSCLARLDADGALDASFAAEAADYVYCFAVQPDGGVLVGGVFTAVGGQQRLRLARLHADGALDQSFAPAFDGGVHSLALQADGKILVAGAFDTVNGQACSSLARLNADGSRDESVTPNTLASPFVASAVALQADGGILVGGTFNYFGGANRNAAARLINTYPATDALTYNAGTLLWQRGGAAPEVWRTAFEHTADGVLWSALGAGAWSAQGWRLSGVTAPLGTIRARGYAVGGLFDSSSWFVETAIGAPVVANAPESSTSDFGGAAAFAVRALGSAPLRYQWRHDGTALTDASSVSGATTTALRVTGVTGGAAGNYDVVVQNAYGATTSRVATLRVRDPLIVTQPASQSTTLGGAGAFRVAAVGTELTYQWRKDGVLLTGATASTLSVTNVTRASAGAYDVAVCGTFACVTSATAYLSVRLALPEEGFAPDLPAAIQAIALQPDGRILLAGVVSLTRRPYLVRLHANGGRDAAFNPAPASSSFEAVMHALALQADGMILVSGDFMTIGGQPSSYLARLRPDGTRDPTFTPALGYFAQALAVQADGRILIGGPFTTVNGQARSSLARLHADGTLDETFAPSLNNAVSAIAIEPDGDLLVAGSFTTVNGQAHGGLARIKPDGTVDAAWAPSVGSQVYSLALQPDGRIVLGGSFATVNGAARSYLARLNADGTTDAGFVPVLNWAGFVYALTLQADGRILAGGKFTTVNGATRNRLARFLPNGALDPSFDVGTDQPVTAVLLQPDGAVLVGGDFDTIAGASHRRFGRVSNPDSATESLDYDGARIQWARGGAAPELGRVHFEHTADGSTWTALGAGVRTAQGWTLDAADLALGTIRALGYAVGGRYDGSPALVARAIGAPTIITTFETCATNAGATVAFAARALGSEPRACQWWHNGVAVADGDGTTGALTETLRLASVTGDDAGDYALVASNVYGLATVAVAHLDVRDPFISVQPTNWSGRLGGAAAFTVQAAGADLRYQWRRHGVALPDATTATLALSAIQGQDVAPYDVVVSSAYGCATSSVARLLVNLAAVDPLFNPSCGSQLTDQVFTLAPLPDGGILVGGAFTRLGGQSRANLGLLDAGGALVPTFHPDANDTVFALTPLLDGRMLVGGKFTVIGGQTRNRLALLAADGTLDPTFKPSAGSVVYALVPQPDGCVLVGGDFTTLGGQTRNRLGRLQADGTLDATFAPSLNGRVYTVALQADGRIVVGGEFFAVNSVSRTYLARLLPDGSLDPGFAPVLDAAVRTVALQADGAILLGGAFTTVNGSARARLARLAANGVLDPGFNPGPDGVPFALAIQTDGGVVVGGGFTKLGGCPCRRLGRLGADGGLDPAFLPEPGGDVYGLALQTDGSILAGGGFTTLGGEARARVGRLSGVGAATNALSADTAAVYWRRAGTAPEVQRTTFEHTRDGETWQMLGAGLRTAGGWTFATTNAQAGTVRVRGYTSGSYGNGSCVFIEDYVGSPLIARQPAACTVRAGDTAVFTVGSPGAGPCTYRWRKAGVWLEEGPHGQGVLTATLRIVDALGGDAGGYDVVLANAYACTTSRVAELTVIDPAILVQPASQPGNRGGSNTLAVVAAGADLRYRWFRNGAPVPDAGAAALTIVNPGADDVGDYTVVVAGTYGCVTSAVAQLSLNLTALDPTYAPPVASLVRALAVQGDGSLLVGGDFTTLCGLPRNRCARLHPGGTLDGAFDPNANGVVRVILAQADGAVLLGGDFALVGAQTRLNLARIRPDGTVDPQFNPAMGGVVRALAELPDGQLLVGGDFTTVGGQTRGYLARLAANGALDTAFAPSLNSRVQTLAVQTDGRIVIGGEFTTVAGQPRSRLARLEADGTLDGAFAPAASANVVTLAVQADGRIVVGGDFTTLNGAPRNHLARLWSDGTLDAGYDPNVVGSVYTLVLQTDGALLVGGSYTTVGGQPRRGLARLRPDGALDPACDPATDGGVYALAMQGDGAILLGGDFATVAGEPRADLARLTNVTPAVESLTCDGSTIVWRRQGGLPECWRAAFAYAVDGATWAVLGAGTRTPDGWVLRDVSAPLGAVLARGFLSSGTGNGSGGLLVAAVGAPGVLQAPTNVTHLAGSDATLKALVLSSAPLTYRWHKAGAPLTDDAHIQGATTAVLRVLGVLGADGGDYDVVAANAYGCVTTAVAVVRVLDPAIASQPAHATRQPGEAVVFGVTAIGTALGYRWRKDGQFLPDATGSVLTVGSLQAADAGGYDVVVEGAYGSLTSAVARLAVNRTTRDPLFAPAADGAVRAIFVQPDGRVTIGGDFTAVAGQTRGCLARFEAHGALDAAFAPAVTGAVHALAMQADGRLVVGGAFTTVGGLPRNRLVRLEPGGTPDAGFDPNANGPVRTVAAQADGRILVGGAFSAVKGQTRHNLARLNADGSLDAAFSVVANGEVQALAVQTDGRIVVGGSFTQLAYTPRSRLGRLSASGALDTLFNPIVDGPVYTIVEQADGRIVIGGAFTTVGGLARRRLARLEAGGAVDPTFAPPADGTVWSLALQADGGLLVGGDFSSIGGQPCNRLARLAADGAPDLAFAPDADATVYALALQRDGAILAGGGFTTLAGAPCPCGARLHNTAPAVEATRFDTAGIVWRRGGTAPEVWRAFFEHSADGVAWSPLVAGARTHGGWQAPWSGVTGGIVRVRGFAAGGCGNGSGVVVERIVDDLALAAQPLGCTNAAGTWASFDVSVLGLGAVVYRWRKDGVPLADGECTAGAATPTLRVGPVYGGDAGAYDVVVVGAGATVTSAVALLRVRDPVIVAQPADCYGTPGTEVSFAVTAVGTDLRYLWRRHGVALPNATGALVRVVLTGAADAGAYDVVVAGRYGVATSAVARLEMPPAVDTGFDPGANGDVYALTVEADGGILVGGSFRTLAGTTRNRLARLRADGSLDAGFNPNAGGAVYAMATQPSGEILVGGGFTTLGGLARQHLARLRADGAPDSAFVQDADSDVYALTPQADGKILVAGAFTTLGGQPRQRLARLHPDGTLDATFAPAVDDAVWTLAVQPDGAVLLGGAFLTVNGQPRRRLARLNAAGVLDNGFSPGASNIVYALTLQADNRILVAGLFTALAGQVRNRLGRLAADGGLDPGYNPNADGWITSLALQTDGRLLVAGSFTAVGGLARNRLARLHPDGSPDAGFTPGANSYVYALAVQADGSVLAGGIFTTLGGQSRDRLARIGSSGLAINRLVCTPGRLAWQRGGSVPEVYAASFAHTPDGERWTALGSGTRAADGWILEGVTVTTGTFRVRGSVAGGYRNGSVGSVTATCVGDVDNDGVPDWWTARHFGHAQGMSNDLSRAGDDASGTGQDNLFKYVAGLDPTNAVSRFRLRIEPGTVASQGPRLVFGPHRQDRVYRILSCRGLVDSAVWTDLSAALTNDVGEERTVTDLHADPLRAFYRVRIAVP